MSGATHDPTLPSERLETIAAQSNDAARNTWERLAVGELRASAPKGTPEYFAQLRAYRYGYETPFIPRAFEFARLRGKRVLEIGVGNGVDGVEMASAGAIYTGVDITQNHLALAELNFAQHRLSGTFVEGDLLDTAVPGAPFDVVYSFGVLHHIAHEDAYLARIREALLAPGGELRIAVYAKYSFFNAYLVATWLRQAGRVPLDAWRSHLAELSPLDRPVTIKIRGRGEIERLLSRAGFRVRRYAREGFVQGYLPVIGRRLDADGAVLRALARRLGWYHVFICEPA